MINELRTQEKFGYGSEDISRGSSKLIVVTCDYCNSEYHTTKKRYNIAKSKFADLGVTKDCCLSCRQKKTEEIYIAKGLDYESMRQQAIQKTVANSDRNASAEKARQTWIAKDPIDIKEIVEKRKETIKAKYGGSSLWDADEYREKIKITMLTKYGVENASQSEEFKEKRRQTMLAKYGVENAGQNIEIKSKIRDTIDVRYGGVLPMNQPGRKEACMEKSLRTRIDNGNILLIDGKTVAEIAQERGISQSHAHVLRRSGVDILTYEKKYSAIEVKLEQMLSQIGVYYIRQYRIGNYIADFFIPDFALAIECDGLWWHSDANQTDNKYHVKKREFYRSNNIRSLFFRSNEILDKSDCVNSIILNKLGKSSKVMARKTKIIETKDHDWFASRHLMSRGSGNTYFLEHEGSRLAGISVKCLNKAKRIYEVSRFCTDRGVSVVGGYSKLMSHAIKALKVNQLITFVDLRYGDGGYLTSLGFNLESCHPSFYWTNGTEVYHRMQFAGNSGYSNKLNKIWDCGQAKYVKYCQHD